MSNDEIKFVPDNVLTELEQMENYAVAEAVANETPVVEGIETRHAPIRSVIPFSVKRPLYRTLLSGFMKPLGDKVKISRYWVNGTLLTQAEHDNLSLDEVREANDNLGRKYK